MSRILHKSFRYVNSAATDIRATFRRIERERKAKAEEAERNQAEVQAKVAKTKITRTA